MSRSMLLPALMLAFASTACADNTATPAPDAEPVASLPPAVTDNDAVESAASPTEPPMETEPPMRRMPGSDDTQAQCDVEAAREFVGSQATADVIEQARAAAGAELVRTLEPGQMVTMEFHNSRLNLKVDDGNIIIDATCG